MEPKRFGSKHQNPLHEKSFHSIGTPISILGTTISGLIHRLKGWVSRTVVMDIKEGKRNPLPESYIT